jgi:hypothetical protein
MYMNYIEDLLWTLLEPVSQTKLLDYLPINRLFGE